ncbi:fibrinogen-like YCDxxxxGGGW domain-containing protein [Flavivirga eckloniae]|uniref:Fibrinogen C-terminal domain-containing protein n=1 Tax=Flavivirga eckloniae TaxID=1803846 RepID=A0A2K9PM54_9FLAO|nr:fibrinogen-like YCDxxxxGGGW domain-containing protein [Flavivirga eckloniae]AUP78130.1 hypothetical protein C1H87_05115 [Flavivirga eckloniae]
MIKITYTTLLWCFSIFYSFSQVGIGTKNPDASSALEISSTTRGLLPPRMTQTQRDAITSPEEGLFIYNISSKCFQYYKGASWSGCLSESQTNKLDCNSISTNGNYIVGVPLTNSNTITIDVLVNSYDTYNITTNTVNGYSFSASGTFTSLGVKTVTLMASGTPLVAQKDTFTIYHTGTDFSCNLNITVGDGYLANCLEYLNDGHSTDGIYTIDPDGPGSNAPYDCYCDMTNNGGGWTLVFNHNIAGGYWANDTEANEHNINSPGITTNKYSILSKLNEIKSKTDYEFRLHYPLLALTSHWSQTFDPRSGPSGTNPVLGYKAINVPLPMTAKSWGGLELSANKTYLDGSANSIDLWYYSIGSNAVWSDGTNPDSGIPANDRATSHVQLFMR